MTEGNQPSEEQNPLNRPIMAETPAGSNCFIGFHDIVPWSPDGTRIAIHRAAPSYFELSDCEKPIEICIWRPEKGAIEAVDTTSAWNFQQGARLQWFPGKADTLVFNTIENGIAVAVIRNVASGERSTLPAPIYAFSPDGKVSIAPNFSTLAHRWRAYGYPGLAAIPLIENQDADGLWQLEIETGKHSLFISTKRAAEFEAANADSQGHFLCHPSISPDGSRVVFLHRFFSSDGGLFTRMIATDRQAKNLVLLAQEKVSHFDWIDNDTILVWARFSGGGLAQIRSRGVLSAPWLKPLLRLVRSFTGRWKKRLLNEAYYKIPIDNPGSKARYGWPLLDADGHPMIARSHRWIVTDTYSDGSGRLPVILYHPDNNVRVDVRTFSHHPRSEDSDVKCDLHPRWSRSEKLVAVDTCEAGYRQVRVLDVSDLVA